MTGQAGIRGGVAKSDAATRSGAPLLPDDARSDDIAAVLPLFAALPSSSGLSATTAALALDAGIVLQFDKTQKLQTR